MNIYLRELKAHRKSLIIWSISMLFLVLAGMGKYSAAVSTQGAGFNEILDQMPKSIQTFLGVGVFDLSVAMDYFGVLFLYIVLVANVHAAMLGAGIIGKEERDKTVEFLMVKPVSRQRIITSKLLAAITIGLILNIVTLVSSVLILPNYTKGQPFIMDLLLLMLGMFAMQLLFITLGTLLAAIFNKHKLSSAIATGVLLLMFMIAIIVDIAGNVDFLRFVSFFKYYDAKDIMKLGYDIAYPIISIILLVIFTSGTYYFYKKRDLRI
ncbi:MAG: putative rane protein [Clostridiales bacterium]|nr:putative rane protein [Clostridiales bacterium]